MGSRCRGRCPLYLSRPERPSKLVGFEVELAEAIDCELGVKVKPVQNAWDSLITALERGDCDIAMNGIEITDQRLERVLFSIPYYIDRAAGGIVAVGPPEEVFTAPRHERTRQFLGRVLQRQ